MATFRKKVTFAVVFARFVTMFSFMTPRPFIIVADLRTGSTLLSSSLDRHPDIRCMGELFHSQDFPDNRIPGVNHFEKTGTALVHHAFRAGGCKAAGFRAMVFLPAKETPRWADAWRALRDYADLRVIFLQRRDYLAQYVSYRIAVQTGKWHPSPDDSILVPEERPRVVVDPEDFRKWKDERIRLYAKRRRQLYGKAILDLDYSQLAFNWRSTIIRVQGFLSADPLCLHPVKKKQERRNISNAIKNIDELKKVGLIPTETQ
mgnify:CR=1 FL=1